MDSNGTTARAVLASGLFGAACGAGSGAIFGGLFLFVMVLIGADARFGFGERLFLAFLAAPWGIGYGLALGALGGFMGGTLGGCLGGPWGWGFGGLYGGRAAGLIPSSIIPFPLETFSAIIGAIIGVVVGITLYAGQPGSAAMQSLDRILNASSLSRWPWWQRVALALALLLVYGLVIARMRSWFGPWVPGGALLHRAFGK